jgi:hypothetical protein
MIIKGGLGIFLFESWSDSSAVQREQEAPLSKGGSTMAARKKNWKRETNQSGRGSPAVTNIGESCLI